MSDQERTHLLNVDLDIVSDSPLEPLVEAFGEKVDVLHVGKWGRRYGARLEVGGSGDQDDPNELINRFVTVVEALPKSRRKLWNQARSREFNVGIEAAARSPMFEWRVHPKTLAAVVRVDGRIVVTVYAPERMPTVPKRQALGKRAAQR